MSDKKARGVCELKQLWVLSYFVVIGIAMIGWIYAFGWATFHIAAWLLR
jgi:hypothetical protein